MNIKDTHPGALAFRKAILLSCTILATLAYASPARADLVLETETARLGKQGQGTVGNAVQFEKDKDGKTVLTETAIEYAPTDRFEILLEPFFYEKQMPKEGDSVSGLGDTELTLSYLAVDEQEFVPAVVVAGKVKIPTASNNEVGTGKFDYTGYVILGKQIGPIDFNANLAYETFGSPDGEKLKDQFIYALSADHNLTDDWSVYAEVFGNSSPATGLDGDFTAGLGTEYKLTNHVNVFTAAGEDTSNLKFLRTGINYTW